MKLKRGSLWSYEGSDLQEFNDMMTHPRSYVKLMVSIWEGNEVWFIILQFLVVHSRSVYNFIMRIPFTTTLDDVASLVHLKLKYHNLQGEPITVNVDLEGEKIIYQALQQDQWEGKATGVHGLGKPNKPSKPTQTDPKNGFDCVIGWSRFSKMKNHSK